MAGLAPMILTNENLVFDWSRPGESTEVEFHTGLEEPLSSLAGRKLFTVIDGNVLQHWEDEIKASPIYDRSSMYVFGADERNKSPEIINGIWHTMSSSGVLRDSTVLVIGGGLTCDVGAFAASCFHRGTRLVLMPTTVLAMADACLGGKTAVNIDGSKNQIGTFFPAELVLIAGCFVNTLSPREYRSGFAEILKAGLIGDGKMRSLLKAPPLRDGDHSWLLELVRRSLKVKGEIVSQDLTETGCRRVLNLGHTFAHALESVSGFELSHGEAVGLGIRAASLMAGREQLFEEIGSLLETLGLPSMIDELQGGIERFMSFIERDKKTSASGGRTWVLPFDWEDCRLIELAGSEERERVRKALDFLLVE